MSKNNLMMQLLSDITQVRIERPLNQESTAMGAAYLAGMKSGYTKMLQRSRNCGRLTANLNLLFRWTRQINNIIDG